MLMTEGLWTGGVHFIYIIRWFYIQNTRRYFARCLVLFFLSPERVWKMSKMSARIFYTNHRIRSRFIIPLQKDFAILASI